LGRGRRALERQAGPAVVAAVVLALVLPALAVKGLVATHAGGDSPFLLQRAHEMSAALAGGHWPARWMAEAAYGLGYPFWVYYAPLAYVAAATLALLGGGVVGGLKVTTLLAFAVAAAGAYALAWAQWRRAAAAVVAAVAYSAAPYHMVNLYVRGDALSELVAYGLLPWLLVAVDRTGRRRGGAVLLAVAVALVLLSHNILALMSVPLAAAYLLWRLSPAGRLDDAPSAAMGPREQAGGRPPAAPVRTGSAGGLGWGRLPAFVAGAQAWLEHRTWRLRPLPGARLALAAAGVALGAGLAAWYWAPALLGRDLVQLEANLSGYFDYRGHFVAPRDLVQAGLVFDYAVDADRAPWKAGLVQVTVALLGAVAGVLLTRRRAAVLFWLGAAAAATWLMTAASQPVWEAVPLLSYVQFPWRWLSVQALALAMLAAPLGAVRLGRVWAALATLALAASVLVSLRVETLGVRDVTSADVQAFELFSGNVGSTVRAEYLPRGVAPRPYASPQLVQGREVGPRALEEADVVDQATLLRRGPAGQAWQLTVSGDGVVPVAFPTLSFPGWTARLGPRDVTHAQPVAARLADPLPPVTTVPGSGWVAVELTPGSHVVELELGRDGVRAAAEGVSLLALAVLAAAMLADRRRRLLRGAVWLVVLVALLSLAARAMPRGEASGPKLMDQLRSPYPRHHQLGVQFGTSRLVRAQLTRDRVRAGEDLALELGWENSVAGHAVEAALVTPAEPVFRVPDVRSRAEQIQTDPVPLRLAVPAEVPGGVYFVRLSVSTRGRPLVATSAEGYELGAVYLGPVRVSGQGEFRERPARPVARMGPLVLHAVQAADAGSAMEVTLFWEAERLLTRDYKVSLRLLDDAGETRAQDDKMPLYGFLPTTAWPPGEQIMDRRWLDVPPELPSAEDYRIEVVVYDEATDEVLGMGQVGGVKVEAGG